MVFKGTIYPKVQIYEFFRLTFCRFSDIKSVEILSVYKHHKWILTHSLTHSLYKNLEISIRLEMGFSPL